MNPLQRIIGLRRYLCPGGGIRFFQVAAARWEDGLDRLWTYYLRVIGPCFCIQIGKSSLIRRGAQLSTRHGGSVRIGERCEILAGGRVSTHGGIIEIGDSCSLNPGCISCGHGGLTLGRGVHVAAYTVIIPSNHIFSDREQFIFEQSEISHGIVSKGDVWIGAQCGIWEGSGLRKVV
jgi:carbonic anhydrase/acetyltransferase-like protein (isoleucine patch superfamily)